MTYYLKSMMRYWNKTLKVIMHYSGVRESEWSEITVEQLYERINSDTPPILLDIRSTEDFNGGYGHIQEAISVPLLELSSKLEALDAYRDKEIVTMCPGGGLSLAAVEILNEAGFKDVKSLQGGTDLWHEKGYPTTKAMN